MQLNTDTKHIGTLSCLLSNLAELHCNAFAI